MSTLFSCHCRVKQLKKDSPEKLPRAQPAVSTQPLAHTQPTLLVRDASPATHTPSKKVAPSLFHPANIQFSSTPKMPPRRSSSGSAPKPARSSPFDLSHALQEAYETPIRGHRVQKVERRRGKDCALGHPPLVVRREAGYKNSPSSSLSSHHHSHSSGSGSSGRRSDRRYRHERDRHVSGDSVPDREQECRDDKSGGCVVTSQDSPRQGDPRKRLFSGSNNDTDPALLDASGIAKHSFERSHDAGQLSNGHVHSQEDSLHSKPANHSRTNTDIIEEHREIMSHLDEVLDKAKAAMHSAASTQRQPSNQPVKGTDTSTEDEVRHAHDKEMLLLRQQELLRTNKSGLPADVSYKGSPSRGLNQHLVSPPKESATKGRANPQQPSQTGSKTHGVSIPMECTSPPQMWSQRSANAQIVEQAFSKLNQAKSVAWKSAPMLACENNLFGAQQAAAQAWSPAERSDPSHEDPPMQQLVLDSLKKHQEKRQQTLDVQSSPDLSSSTTSISIPVQRLSSHLEPKPQDNKVKVPGCSHVPHSEDFLKSLVGLKMARQLLDENLTKGDTTAPAGDLHKNYKHHLDIMNRNLKAAHLRPFEDLLGSPSNTRRGMETEEPKEAWRAEQPKIPPQYLPKPTTETSTAVHLSASEQGPAQKLREVPVLVERKEGGSTGQKDSDGRAVDAAEFLERDLRINSLEGNASESDTKRDLTGDFSNGKGSKRNTSILSPRKNTERASSESDLSVISAEAKSSKHGHRSRDIPTMPRRRPLWAEVLSSHALDTNHNVQKDAVNHKIRKDATGDAPTLTQTLGSQVPLKSDKDSGIATQDVITPEGAVTVEGAVNDHGEGSDVDTLDDITSLLHDGATAALSTKGLQQKLKQKGGSDPKPPETRSTGTSGEGHTREMGNSTATKSKVLPLSQSASQKPGDTSVRMSTDVHLHGGMLSSAANAGGGEVPQSVTEKACDGRKAPRQTGEKQSACAASEMTTEAPCDAAASGTSNRLGNPPKSPAERTRTAPQETVAVEQQNGAMSLAQEKQVQQDCSTGQRLYIHEDSAFTKVHQNTPSTSQSAMTMTVQAPRKPLEGKSDTTISPIKVDKLGSADAGTTFSPIHPFPLTPRDSQDLVISVPSVITKTVLRKDSADSSTCAVQGMNDSMWRAAPLKGARQPLSQAKLGDGLEHKNTESCSRDGVGHNGYSGTVASSTCQQELHASKDTRSPASSTESSCSSPLEGSTSISSSSRVSSSGSIQEPALHKAE